MSTGDINCLITFQNKVNNYFAHFIDFSKAFGYVASDISFFKLIKYGHYRVNVYV